MPAQSRVCSLSFLLTLFLCFVRGLFPGTALAAPSITLSKKVGPPTSKILVSGGGFEPNVGVDIFFDTKDEALVVTNNEGKFHNAPIHAPRSAKPGEHWITALERNNDKGDQEPFVVFTNWSEYRFSPERTGQNPYENVLNPLTTRNLDLKWSYHTSNIIYSSPAVENGVVYTASYDNNVYRLERPTPEPNSGATATGGTVYSSPAVANGVVYVGSWDANVYALDARTGKEVSSFPTGGEVQSSPTVVDGVVYVGSLDDNLYALDAHTGSKLWSYATGNSVYSSPAVADGVVYVGSLNSICSRAWRTHTGSKLWSYATGNSVYSSPAVADGVVYVARGTPTSTRWMLGQGCCCGAFQQMMAAMWILRPQSRTGWFTRLLYMTTSTRWTQATVPYYGAIRLATVCGRRPQLPMGWLTSAPTTSTSTRWMPATGGLLWIYPTGGEVQSSPTVVDGVVYVGSLDDNVYAFALPSADDQEAYSADRPNPRSLHFDLTFPQPSALSSSAK